MTISISVRRGRVFFRQHDKNNIGQKRGGVLKTRQ